MSYVSRLIGNIEPGLASPDGKLTLPEIPITEAHILHPTTLRTDYGTLGEGLEHIVSNPFINQIILQNNSDLAVGAKDVLGLDNIPDAERNVVQALLTAQYDRSRMIYRLASKEELQNYDNVTKGVFKGTTLGGVVGGFLYAIQKTFDFSGIEKIAIELLARAGPGFYEAVAISQEVSENGGSKKGSTHEMHIGQLFVEAEKELPKDALRIAKSIVDKDIWYDAVNIGGGLDKIIGRKGRATRDGYTEEWAEAQESGPARGLIALGVLKGLREAYPPLDENVALRVVYGLAEAAAVFWVNTGNNVQGGWSVYKKCVDEARAAGSTEPWKAGGREYLSDPFQIANLIVCTVWYGVEATLRSAGLRPEEQLGALGAALESSILSWDTAVAAQVSKRLSRYLVVNPAEKSVRPYNLMNLALEYGAASLQERLMEYREGRSAFARHQRLTSTSPQ